MKLLALLCAFDLALLLEHFLGRLLARTRGGANVVVKSALGHGAIRSFNHLGLHGLLDDLALAGGLSPTCLSCTDISTTGGCRWVGSYFDSASPFWFCSRD